MKVSDIWLRNLHERLYRPSPGLVALCGAVLCGLLLAAQRADAQYFGRNKVQYDRLDFRVLPTEHFRIHFYPAESLATADAARMAERWHTRLQSQFRIPLRNNAIIFYADHADFQQTNVIEGEISPGTGGVTEGLRERVIMPFTGSYAETDHVLGHELVHAFQYRIAATSEGGLRTIGNIPLWLIEGMAEYLSVGRNDPNTAMWLRDALRRNDLPTLEQLTRDPRYFPYRYGQALWAYIGGTWGDDAIPRVFRAALKDGWEKGVASALGVSTDSLSARWHAAVRTAYGPLVTARTAPDSVGRAVVVANSRGEQNVSPAISPDGRMMAYFSSRGLFGIDLYVAEVATGRVIQQLTSVARDAHFDALSFINSAGSWSPDGAQLAYVVYAEGDQEINIVDVRSGDVRRRIAVDGVTALADPAWSPDGTRIAFSGFKGGLSDLYVYDLASGRTAQLTNDREAQLQPAWSPDNARLAFVTDADPATSFTTLAFASMRLAVMPAAGGSVELLPRIGNGKHINPQFTPDGAALYFVADVDGVSDVYRRSLASGSVERVTAVATGVSGITTLSPAISVARESGALVFSVFDQKGFSVRMIAADAPRLASAVGSGASGARAGLLPPSDARAPIVAQYLNDATGGLPSTAPTRTVAYSRALKLDYVGGPQIGVATGGTFGTGVAGGVAFGFGDELGNRTAQAAVQATGEIRDIGGQAQYLNRSHRWNWGIGAAHVPLAGGFATAEAVTIPVDGETYNGVVYARQTVRQYLQSANMITQYPLSSTRRVEFSAGGQRVAFSREVDSIYTIGGTVVREARTGLPAASALTFASGSAAFVGDYALFAFTSPVAGGRYRFEVSPSFGSINYTTALADYRRYFLARPVTLAIRGMHVGRYGPGAENERLPPYFVGQPFLLRGYDPYSFRASECGAATDGDQCPQLSRLSGSRFAIASAELRIPLLGSREFGLIPFNFLPLELSPFVDAGVAWSANDPVTLAFDRTTAKRVPVVSVGVTSRVNVLGFAVLEIFWANPLQRPGRGGLVGFQLQPGW